MVADAAWLEHHGYSRGLRHKYVRNGWLDQLGRGVYCRARSTGPGSTGRLRWETVVISLQTLLERSLVVGGRTALERQGFAHYLSPGGPREVHLYGENPPPGWLSKLELDTRFRFHRTATLFRAPLPDSLTRQPWGEDGWEMALSSPERALLELLDELPARETFHQADVLVEGLRTLSPRRLQTLLEDCRSVKVKRLFFWFAERHNQPWLAKIDRSRIDLGRGKRMLVRGGKLDAKYEITVPGDMSAAF
jgi:hypothetical protein